MDGLTPPRIAALDLVRGVAVCGILVMNIAAFAMPLGASIDPAVWGHEGLADRAVWAASFVLFEGKMRALFAMLFGASVTLVMRRAAAAGRNPAVVHAARMAVLLPIGLAHHYWLWFGDILSLYAACGFLLLWMKDKPTEELPALALALLLAAMLLTMLALFVPPLLPAGAAYDADIAAEIARHRAGWSVMTAWRLSEMATLPLDQFVSAAPETLAQMLMGRWLLERGFFDSAWRGQPLARLGGIALVIALPALALLAGWAWVQGFGAERMYAIALLWTLPFNQLAAFGYAALLIRWSQSGRSAGLARRFALAGQTALTNYLGMSLIMVLFFDTAGLFGTMGRAALLLPVAGGVALMLAWPPLWLGHMRHGPVEWLWRSAAQGRLAPWWRRSAHDAI